VEQIFYIGAVIVLLIIARRLMAKIKDETDDETNEDSIGK
jgi:hypothetical protein